MDCQSVWVWVHTDWPYELSIHRLYEKKKEGTKKKKKEKG